MIRNTGLPDGGLWLLIVAPRAICVASSSGAGALAPVARPCESAQFGPYK